MKTVKFTTPVGPYIYNNDPRKVVVKGVVYPSINKAVKGSGMTRCTITYRCKTAKFTQYGYVA